MNSKAKTALLAALLAALMVCCLLLAATLVRPASAQDALPEADATDEIVLAGPDTMQWKGSWGDWARVNTGAPAGEEVGGVIVPYWSGTRYFGTSFTVSNADDYFDAYTAFGEDSALSFWMYVGDVTKLTAFDITILSSVVPGSVVYNFTLSAAGTVPGFSLAAMQENLQNGWNHITLRFGQNQYNSPLSGMTDISHVTFTPTVSEKTEIYFYGISMVRAATADVFTVAEKGVAMNWVSVDMAPADRNLWNGSYTTGWPGYAEITAGLPQGYTGTAVQLTVFNNGQNATQSFSKGGADGSFDVTIFDESKVALSFWLYLNESAAASQGINNYVYLADTANWLWWGSVENRDDIGLENKLHAGWNYCELLLSEATEVQGSFDYSNITSLSIEVFSDSVTLRPDAQAILFDVKFIESDRTATPENGGVFVTPEPKITSVSGNDTPASFADGKYTLSVGYEVTDVTLSAAAYEGATVSFAGAGVSGSTVTLGGEGSVTPVTVVSELNGAKVSVTLEIVRGKRVLSTECDLTSLTVGGQTVTLEEGTLQYDVTVPSDTKFVDIVAKADDYATIAYQVGGAPLEGVRFAITKVGDSKVLTIVVTAEDETATKTYTVNVTRQDLSEDFVSITGTEDIKANGSWDVTWTETANAAPVGMSGQSAKPHYWPVEGTMGRFNDTFAPTAKDDFTIDYFGEDTAITFWLYISDVSGLSTGNQIYIWGNTRADGTYYNLTYDISEINGDLVAGWNKISLKLVKDTIFTDSSLDGNPDWHYIPEQTDMSTSQGVGYIIYTTECVVYVYDLKIENLPEQTEDVAVVETQAAGSQPIAEGDYEAAVTGETAQTYLETQALTFTVTVTDPMVVQNPSVSWTVKSGEETVATLSGLSATWTPENVGTYTISVKVGELAEKQVGTVAVSYRAIRQGDLSITVPEGGEASVAPGESVLFTAALSQSVDPSHAEEVRWYVDGAAVENASGLSFTFTPAEAGSYLVSARIGDTVLTEDILVTVAERRPLVSASSQNVTLTEGQTEIELSGAYSVTGDMEYTVKLFCDGVELQNDKLTVANESKVYTITVRVSGEGFTEFETTFSVSVTAYSGDETSGGGCGSALAVGGGAAILSAALLAVFVLVLKKRAVR